MKSRKGGFTVTEMLTVVGILAVIMAAAVPAAVTLRDDLKMRELDDTAREIFLAAQNSLTARKAAGTPLKLGEEDGGAGEGGNADGYYWLSSGHPDMKTLLPAGSLESAAADNHSIIWYNADTATVLEVYYAETPMDADKIKNREYSDIYNTLHRAARREAKIGYYNGGDLGRGDIETLAPPLLTIKNGNELTVTVTVPKAAEYAGRVRLTVTVEELAPDGTVVSGHSREFSGSAAQYDPTTGELRTPLLLDSLTGEHFKDICEGQITPGANIRVTAALAGPADGEKIYLPASAHADANSLFAGRGTADGGNAFYIACPRHLQNLEPAVSGLPESGNCYAEQTAEIVWPAGTEFRPICSENLRGYHGNGNEITGLLVNCNNSKTGGAGLFGFAAAARLSNIRLVDPVLTGTDPAGAEYVGALAGRLQGSEVSGCQVYATENAAGIDCAGKAVGGLIGLAEDNCEITGSSASLPGIKSAANGAYIGGLIGRANASRDSSVSRCYADTGWMGSNKKWDPEYGMRGTGSAATGGLIGQALGFNEVTDCYALGWYSGGGDGRLVGEIIGVAAISRCYSILQSGSGSHYYTYEDSGERSISSLSDLQNFSGTGWRKNGLTTPYHPGICPAPYPYPMLSLRHYGDWPVQTVDGVRLFDGTAAESRELHYIMVPAGKGTVTFYAEARSGENPAMEAAAIGGKGAGITDAKAEYDKTTGRTEVTLTFPEDDTGAAYVDLRAGEFTLRAVVVLYDATVTLTGQNPSSGVTAASKAFSNGNESETGTLPLSTSAKTGTFTAEMTVRPGKNDIETALGTMQAGTGGQFKISAGAADFTSWEGIRSGDPSVTANGDPDAGTNILSPDGGSYYPEAGPDGTLTVTGAASGTAAVSARWGMDEALKADCEVKMAGARALIEKASAMSKGGPLGEKSGYPYRLDLIAEPGEQINLTFTPKLFGGYTGEDGTYTWAVIRTEEDGSRTILTQGEPTDKITSKPSDAKEGKWTYPLADNRSRANYTVTLTYTNGSGEKSVDFMTFSVYRAAGRGVSDYQGIRLYHRKTRKEISGTEAGQVEQIHSLNYPDVDTLLLEGCVDGAENTRVRWWARAKGGSDWMQVTGIVGSQTVLDENGEARAKVEWKYGVDKDSNENYDVLGAGVNTFTGGAILVTGLDVNEYGRDFEIELKAEAMESAGDGGAPSCKIVTVKVMRKLEIIPKAKTVVSIWSNDYTFCANRKDTLNGWQFEWSWTGKGTGISNGDSYKISPSLLQGDKNQRNTVTCKYGPYTATATYTWLGLVEKLTASINADCTADDKEYFIVEKGETQDLALSWGCSLQYYIMTEQTGRQEYVTLTAIDDSESSVNSEYAEGEHWYDGGGYIGNRKYTVTGNEFTGPGVETLQWRLRRVSIPRYEYAFDKYFAVVGMEINGDNHLVLQKDQTVQLSTTISFARELWEDGAEPVLSWESDHTDLVEVDQTGKITAVKNGAATYSATITATCTVKCRNGKTYTFKDYVTVKVRPEGTMHVTLEPCTAGDVPALNQTFDGAGLTASSVLVPVDGEGRWTLIRSEDFGLNTMYLKAAATLDGMALPSLRDYSCNVSGDASYLSIEPRESGGTLYIRLRAKEANVDVTGVNLTAEIGTASAGGTVCVYDAPSVKLTLPDGTDVTNGSRPVYLNSTDLSVTLAAELVPTLYSYGDTAKTTPLNTIAWALEASTGYEPGRYLDLAPADGGENRITVTLKQEDRRIPDFRVVLHARGREGGGADAGYALVFLPEEESEEP